MHALAIALALAAAPLTLPGEMVGAADNGPPAAKAIVVVTAKGGQSRIHILGDGGRKVTATSVAPKGTIGVIPCGPRGVLYLDDNGVRDINGNRVIASRPLIGGGKPDVVRLFSLCGPNGEIRLPTKAGFTVVGHDQTVPIALRMRHQARSYGPRSQTGLPRAYEAAWTNYVPRTFDANIDDDAALEFLVVSETTLTVFDRDASGALLATPARTIALRRAFSRGVAPGASTRVVVGDVDQDGRMDVVVTQFDSVFSKRTRAAAIHFDGPAGPGKTATIRTTALFDDEGFSVVLGVVGNAVVRAQIPTGVMALSSALLSGVVTVNVQRIDRARETHDVVSTTLVVDVPRAKLLGTLPQLVFAEGESAVLIQPDGERATLHFGPRLAQTTAVGSATGKSISIDLGRRLLRATSVAGRTQVVVVPPPTPSRAQR